MSSPATPTPRLSDRTSATMKAHMYPTSSGFPIVISHACLIGPGRKSMVWHALTRPQHSLQYFCRKCCMGVFPGMVFNQFLEMYFLSQATEEKAFASQAHLCHLLLSLPTRGLGKSIPHTWVLWCLLSNPSKPRSQGRSEERRSQGEGAT